MLGTEIEFSRVLIEKAERRLSHQRSTVESIDVDDDPEIHIIGHKLLDILEAKVSLLHDHHRELLCEAMRAPFC